VAVIEDMSQKKDRRSKVHAGLLQLPRETVVEKLGELKRA
jgi:hypothetical protein